MSDLIENALRRLGDRIIAILKLQAPQPPVSKFGNIYATGRLRDSIRATVRNQNSLSISYNRYGVGVDFGTGANAVQPTGPFGMPERRNYSYNGQGIVPQYWTTLTAYEGEIRGMVEGEVLRLFDANLKTTSSRVV